MQLTPDAFQTTRAAMAQRRVLCATNLSLRSQRAMTRAVLLAHQLDAELILLHVADPSRQSAGSVPAREQIAQQLSSIGLPLPREPQIRLHTGQYLQIIATVARETDPDLIILGPQRRKTLAPLIGTSAERITRLARHPVLVVNRDTYVRYSAVLVAAELSAAFSEVIRAASSLRFLQADAVAIVHGFESPYRGPLYAEGFDSRAATRNIEEWEKATKRELLLSLDAAGIESARFRLVFQQSLPIHAIQRVVRSVQADLLIVGTKHRSAFNRLIHGSVANDALRSIECDILVVPTDTYPAGVLH